MASLQTNYLRNYHLLTLAMLMRHQDFCNTIFATAKLSIPLGRRNNYRPCWNSECEHLYQVFLRAPQSKATITAASVLLSHLDKKRKDRWSEAVNNINFTHFSRLAWNRNHNLTGRARHTRLFYPITANSIAVLLIKNRIYKTTNRESARLIVREVSQLWKIPILPDKCIFGDFSSEKFANALQLLKSGKTPDPDSLRSELMLYAGSALSSG